jgi:hypothetical protein
VLTDLAYSGNLLVDHGFVQHVVQEVAVEGLSVANILEQQDANEDEID